LALFMVAQCTVGVQAFRRWCAPLSVQEPTTWRPAGWPGRYLRNPARGCHLRQLQRPRGAPGQPVDIVRRVQVGDEARVGGFENLHLVDVALEAVAAGQAGVALQDLHPRVVIQHDGFASLRLSVDEHARDDDMPARALLERGDQLDQLGQVGGVAERDQMAIDQRHALPPDQRSGHTAPAPAFAGRQQHGATGAAADWTDADAPCDMVRSALAALSGPPRIEGAIERPGQPVAARILAAAAS